MRSKHINPIQSLIKCKQEWTPCINFRWRCISIIKWSCYTLQILSSQLSLFPVFFFCHIATFKEDCFSIEGGSTFEQSHNCNMVLNPMSEKKRIYLYIQLKRLILIESFYSALLAEWYTTIYGTQIPMDHQKSKTEEMFYEKEKDDLKRR